MIIDQLYEFAPSDDGEGPDQEELLRRLAAHWWNGNERQMAKVENTLAAMGWEIGQDEGYDDGGVFVVRAGDEHGRTYTSWSAEELDMNEAAPPGAKAERMVKHIKQGYARDGKLTPKEKGIAFATAWKAHNAGRVEEATEDEYQDDYEDEETELCNGCYVRDKEDSSGEIFVMRGDPGDRRVRIEDRHGRGWNIAPYRLTVVDDSDLDIAAYFGDELDEAGVTEAAQGHTIEAHGVRGMDRRTWHKTFRNTDQMIAWAEKHDAEIIGTRDLEQARHHNLSPANKGVTEAFPNPGSGSTGTSKEDKRIAAALRKKHIPTTPNDKKEKGVAEGSLNELSKDTLKSYAKKAVPDMQASQNKSKAEYSKATSAKDDETANKHYDAAKQAKDRTEKRMAGVAGAIKRFNKEGVAEGWDSTYIVKAMDTATGEHWALEIKATSPKAARERAEAQGYKVLRIKEKGVAEGLAGYDVHKKSTSNNNSSPELRGITIPGDMKHPGWKEPTWSFQEVAEKLGVSPKELQQLALSIGNFPKKVEGLTSRYGSKAYYPRSEIKRWVNATDIRNIIKSKQDIAEGLTEMDKSEPSAGRDTGPRPGPDREAKPISAKKATRDAGRMLNRAFQDSHKKKDVKESDTLMLKLQRAMIKEGRVKELADDLKTMSDADFMKKYGKAKAAIRKDMKRVDEAAQTNYTPQEMADILSGKKTQQQVDAERAKKIDDQTDDLVMRVDKQGRRVDKNGKLLPPPKTWTNPPINPPPGKMQQYEGLDELSTNKLAQYKTAAAKDAKAADQAGDFKRGDKRLSGMVQATKKQFDNDAKKVDESRAARRALMARIVNSR